MDIQIPCLVSEQKNVLHRFLQSRRLHGHRVGCGRKRREVELPAAVGGGGAGDRGILLGYLYLRSGHNRTGVVGDGSADRYVAATLGEPARHTCEDSKKNPQTNGPSTVTTGIYLGLALIGLASLFLVPVCCLRFCFVYELNSGQFYGAHNCPVNTLA